MNELNKTIENREPINYFIRANEKDDWFYIGEFKYENGRYQSERGYLPLKTIASWLSGGNGYGRFMKMEIANGKE